MRIEIEIRPIEKMRYATCGDYFYKEDGTLRFEIADTGNEFYNKMILIHEMVEEALTKHLGITEKQIMDFDLYYEKRREQGLVPKESEPGFDKNAPYVREHTVATAIEMLMCAHAGISWNDYDNHVMNM